jgi:hypothetical protein
MDARRVFLDRLHELCEWENELSYHDGYMAGYESAIAQVEAALRYALGGEDTRTLRQAASRHQHALAGKALRELQDEPGPRPGDHLGGPVPWEGSTDAR